jgi:hypothetical protein
MFNKIKQLLDSINLLDIYYFIQLAIISFYNETQTRELIIQSTLVYYSSRINYNLLYYIIDDNITIIISSPYFTIIMSYVIFNLNCIFYLLFFIFFIYGMYIKNYVFISKLLYLTSGLYLIR